MMRRILCVLWVLLMAGGNALAAEYPERPIRMIIPYVAGGGTDNVGRLLVEHVGKTLNTTLVVENRPGGTGSIGAAAVKNSAPDGYTILMTGPGLVQFPLLSKKAQYELTDFVPVIHLLDGPFFTVVSRSTPARSLRELVDYAKKNPGKLMYGSSGIGSPGHLTGELFQALTGVQLTHVPYKGGADVLRAVLSNEVNINWDTYSTYAQYQASGQLRPLAIARKSRFSGAPDVPSMPEAGVPELADFEVGLWFGILVPAATPRAIVDKLNAAFNQALEVPAVRTKLAEWGMAPAGGRPESFVSLISSDQNRWRTTIRNARITAD